MFGEDAGNNVGNVIELHYLPVDDRVRLKVFKTEIYQLESISLFT